MEKRINKISIKECSQSYPYLPEPPDKEIMYYLTSFGHEYLNSDYYLSRKNNDLFMINYVVKGSFSLTIDGVTQIMKAGDLCFLNLIKPSVMFPVDDNTEIYFFHFQGKDLKKIYNSYLNHGQHVLSGVSLDEMQELFRGLAKSIGNGKDLFLNSALIYSFLMKILSQRIGERQLPYPPIVMQVLRYIWIVFPTPTSKEIAKHFNYNQIYLERIFKQHVGESLGKYLQKKKYGQACQYLMDSDMSIDEIALKVGYKTSQGLIALFKKFGDTTPLVYRKSLKDTR